MAKYTFSQACPKDVYTLVATGVTGARFIFSENGRVIAQDTADTDPAENATGYMPVAAGKIYDLGVLTGLEIFYRPWAVDATTVGYKK